MEMIGITSIGSFPKFSISTVKSWWEHPLEKQEPTSRGRILSWESKKCTFKDERDFIVKIQQQYNLYPLSDGEVRRDSYVFYFARALSGIDFKSIKKKTIRNGTWNIFCPIIRDKVVKANSPILEDFLFTSEAHTLNTPVKVSIPGPLTLMDSLLDEFYFDADTLVADLTAAVSHEAQALSSAGCRHIQLDEPVFIRNPDLALRFGSHVLNSIAENLHNDTTLYLHICGGYSNILDEHGRSADLSLYEKLSKLIDDSRVDFVMLEWARNQWDISRLSQFERVGVVLGLVTVTSSKTEFFEDRILTLSTALQYLPEARLMIAPDCGFSMLSWPQVEEKLSLLSDLSRGVASTK